MAQVGGHRLQIIERRGGPFGILHRFTLQILGGAYLGKAEGSMTMGSLLFERTYRSFEMADTAHTRAIEGLSRGGLAAAKERLREPLS